MGLTLQQRMERRMAITLIQAHFKTMPDVPLTYYQRSGSLVYPGVAYDETVRFHAVRWTITWGRVSQGIGVQLEGKGLVLVDPHDETNNKTTYEEDLYWHEFENAWGLFALLPLDPRMFD